MEASSLFGDLPLGDALGTTSPTDVALDPAPSAMEPVVGAGGPGGPRRKRGKLPPVAAPPDPQQSAAWLAAQRNPEQWAKVLQLADRIKADPEYVAKNYETLSKAAEQHTSQREVGALSPAMRDWIRDPNNATLAKHEVAPLAQVDRGAAMLAQPAPDARNEDGALGQIGTATATGAADLGSAAGHLAAAFGLMSPAQAAAFVADQNQRATSLRSQAPDYAKEFAQSSAEHSGAVDKAFHAFGQAQAEKRRSGILDALTQFTAALTKGIPAPTHVVDAATTGEALALIGAAARRPRGLAYQGLESVPSMAPMIAGAAGGSVTGGTVGSIAGPAGAAVGAAAGGMLGTFAGMAPVTVGSEINAELQKRGIDVTDPAALEQAFSDPALMHAIRLKAAKAGVTNAAVVALVSGFAGKMLAGAEGGNMAQKVAAAAGDVGVQAAGMGAAQMAGQVASGEPASPGAALSTAIQMLGVGAAMEGVGASRRAAFHADPIEAAAQATTHADKALRAARDAQVLAEVGQAVKQSPTTAGVPDRLKSLVETATGGREAGAVYFQTGEWDAHWMAQGASPAKAAADIMGDQGKAYSDAKATGAHFAIPLGDYIAHVAPTEHWEALLPVARTTPDGLTLGEAHEYLQSLPATLKDIATEATAAAAKPAEPDAAAAVGTGVAEQLQASGIGPVAAKAQGKLYESTFRALGERLGVDPKALFDRFKLAVGPGDGTATHQQAYEQRMIEAVSPDEARAMFAAMSESGFAGGAGAATVDVPRGQKIGGADDTVTMMRTAMGYAGKEAFRAAADAEIAKRGVKGDTDGEKAAIEQTARNIVAAGRAAGELFQPDYSEGARGRIVFGQNGINIDLFAKADRSTFLHETGHFYLHVLDTLASEASAPDELKADRATVRSWLNADSTAPLTREQHEQFARGFEAYLMEGKAPTAQLRAVFQRFKTWLTAVYSHLTALNVELSPEIRAVMDRLVAGNDELARAEAEQAVAPLFDDPKAVGMTDAQAARYTSAVQEAHDSAAEALTATMMKELRREESAEWAAWREPIEKQVAAEVAKSPVYRALTELTASFKIDRAAAKELLGPDAVRQLPKGVTATENGVHPDVAAELLGFRSGQDLLTQLAHAPAEPAMVKLLTDERMRAEHGERMSDADVRTKAAEVVHGEKRAQLLRLELEHLASQNMPALTGIVRAITKVVPPSEAVKAQARDLIGTTAVRDLRPERFEQAATRMAKAAKDALLKGDLPAALDAKRQELLATEVFNAATDAKTEMAKALDSFKQVFRSDERIAPTRDMELVNAARAVLASFGIGSSDKPASEYLAQVRQYDPETADTMQAIVDSAVGGAGGAQDYKTMPMDAFRVLADAVRGLWSMARTTRQLTVDGVKMDRLQAQAELVARVQELTGNKIPPGTHEALTQLDRTKTALLSFKASATKAEHWVRLMDGGASDGPFRRLLFNRVREATDLFRVRKGEELSAYADALNDLRKQGLPITKAKIPAPELDYTFAGHNELLGALLHAGNESNLAKNLIGRGWAELRDDGSVDTSRWDGFLARLRKEGVLTKAHYDWAQDVWDRLEALKPDAQQAHRQMYGRYFSEITATPFTNEYGEYRGGYYPAKADPEIVPEAEARADRDKLLGENTSFMFPPSVGKGFTISRIEGYRKPLVMDAAAVPQHIDAVLRFTHIGPAVREVGRVVLSPEVREALRAMDPTIVGDMLVPWLERAGQQRSEARVEGNDVWRGLNKAAGVLRRNTALQLMTANSTVLLEQLTHMPSVLVRVPVADVTSGLWKYMTNHGEVARSIAESSPFMRTREGGIIDDARGTVNKILLDPSAFSTVRDFSQVHGRFLMSAVQSVMDHAVWTAVYDRATETMEHDEAVRHADATVRELMGSYAPEDVSAIEASSAVARLFNMFAGFFLTKANVLNTELGVAGQLGYSKSKAKVAVAVTFGLLVPAMMGLGVKNVMAGKGVLHQQDDEGTLHALLSFAGEASLDMMARMVPFGGPALLIAERSFHKGRQDDLLSSPAVKMAGDAIAAPGHLSQGIAAHEVTAKEITDIFSLIGLVTGFPARPVGKAVGFMYEAHTGRQDPQTRTEYARGVLTGHVAR